MHIFHRYSVIHKSVQDTDKHTHTQRLSEYHQIGDNDDEISSSHGSSQNAFKYFCFGLETSVTQGLKEL